MSHLWVQVTLPSYLRSCPEDPVGALQGVRKTKEGPEGLAMKEVVSLLRDKADTRDQLSVTLKGMWEILPRFKMRETNGKNQIKNWLELKARITTVTPLHIDRSPSRRLRSEQCPTVGRWVVSTTKSGSLPWAFKIIQLPHRYTFPPDVGRSWEPEEKNPISSVYLWKKKYWWWAHLGQRLCSCSRC